MSSQMLSIVVTTVKKNQAGDVPVQLTIPMGISFSDAKDSCLEFIGVIEEMSKNAEAAAKKAEEEKAAESVEGEVVNIQ